MGESPLARRILIFGIFVCGYTLTFFFKKKKGCNVVVLPLHTIIDMDCWISFPRDFTHEIFQASFSLLNPPFSGKGRGMRNLFDDDDDEN